MPKTIKLMAEEQKLVDLPTVPVKATRTSPKILILYSLPKVGKTYELAQLPGCLILDAEGGAEGYDCLRFSISSSADIVAVRNTIIKMGEQRYKDGLRGEATFPYQFIALDTADKIEEFADTSATEKYKKSKLNLNGKFEEKGYTSVTELAEGGGYYHLRNEMLELVMMIAEVCPRLIITCHVKDKKIADKKTGEVIVVSDLSLIGKMGSILCSKADAIGYMYRNGSKEHRGELWVSFETYESAVMGARQKYLAGQKIPFSWKTIYPDLFPESQPTEKQEEVDKKSLKAGEILESLQ